MLNKFLIIAIGAIPGCLIRWQLDNDFLANIIGAGLFGLIIGCSLRQKLHLLLGVGFCGSLTTFSGWIMHSYTLILNGYFLDSFGLILSTLALGLLSAGIGYLIGLRLLSRRLTHPQLRLLIRHSQDQRRF